MFLGRVPETIYEIKVVKQISIQCVHVRFLYLVDHQDPVSSGERTLCTWTKFNVVYRAGTNPHRDGGPTDGRARAPTHTQEAIASFTEEDLQARTAIDSTNLPIENRKRTRSRDFFSPSDPAGRITTKEVWKLILVRHSIAVDGRGPIVRIILLEVIGSSTQLKSLVSTLF